MKGFSLALTLLIIAALSIAVLVFVNSFFLSQSGTAMTNAEAQNIFYSRCSEYEREGFAWSVTRSEGFKEFLEACKVLFGEQNGRFSCLFDFCGSQSQNLACDSLCNACAGFEQAGADKSLCCGQFASTCETSCSVCG